MVTTLAQRIAAQNREAAESAALDVNEQASEVDAMLREIIGDAARYDDVHPTIDQLEYFDAKGWFTDLKLIGPADRPRLRTEIVRMMRVIMLERQAGTTADREAMAHEATIAAEELAKRAPTIEAQIDKLQTEYRQLATAAERSANRLNESHNAVEGLRDQIPSSIEARVHRRRQMIRNSSENAIMLELQGRKASIVGILKLSGQQRLDYIGHNKELRRAPQDPNPVDWTGHCAKLQAELADINKKLPAIEAKVTAEFAKAEELKDYYAR